MIETLLLTQLAATLYMTGVIWFVQLVHYPLFDRVTQHFPEFAMTHATRTGSVVMAPMILELGTTVALYWHWPSDLPKFWYAVNLLSVLVIWASTFLLQVPCHEQLQIKFDAAIHRKLVNSNWIRTLIWTLRSFLSIWMLTAV